MTLNVATSLGAIKVTPRFKISKRLRKKIEESLKLAVDETKPVEELLAKIKKRIPWVDSPRGALVAYMTGQSWTQKRLAKATGIPQGNISAMISGKRPIGPATARRLAETFGVDYRKFL
ncbi:MAG: helix-turn-helix transcriptional regulator [Deltaproteobacteria bacterium]|nr:helix-turn-helix transcriptional regulator [Deltaproteobacteria bacterium]